jgi:hypothetical protein
MANTQPQKAAAKITITRFISASNAVEGSTTNQLQKADGLPLQSSTACRKALAKRSARSGAMKYNQRCSLEKGLPMRAFVTVFSGVAVMTFLSLVAVIITIPILFPNQHHPRMTVWVAGQSRRDQRWFPFSQMCHRE